MGLGYRDGPALSVLSNSLAYLELLELGANVVELCCVRASGPEAGNRRGVMYYSTYHAFIDQEPRHSVQVEFRNLLRTIDSAMLSPSPGIEDRDNS